VQVRCTSEGGCSRPRCLGCTSPGLLALSLRTHIVRITLSLITGAALLLTMIAEVSKVWAGQCYHAPLYSEYAADFIRETDNAEFWFHDSELHGKSR